MNIIDLKDLVVDAASRSLIDDLESLRGTIDAARPLPADLVSRIRQELLEDRVFNSNSIEGNTLSLRETRAILESGQIVDVGRTRENQEALNLGAALRVLEAHVNSPAPYALESLFLEVHRTLFEGLRDDIGGKYRSTRVLLSGAKHQPPRPELIAPALAGLFGQLSSSGDAHPTIVAAWAHWVVSRVHPFDDGNGRMARMWQDLVLLSHRYTPAVIPVSQRKSYYAALADADEGDFPALLQIVLQAAIATSRLYVNVLREADDVAGWAASLAAQADQVADDTLRLEYSRWSARISELRDSFQRCLTLLNRSSPQMSFDLDSYDPVDQATWRSLRSEPGAPGAWSFRITAQGDSDRLQYVFFAGKHCSSDLDDEVGLTGGQVGLFASEQRGAEESSILRDDNSPITFRELLVIDNEFVRKRWDGSLRKLVYDAGLSSLTIAQEFLQEVVLHRLTRSR